MSNHDKTSDWMVNSSSWHFQLYQIAVAMWCKWTSNDSDRYEYVNLCTYVRMITVLFPMMMVIFLVLFTSPIWISVVMMNWYGIDPALSALWGTTKVIGWIVFALVVIVCIFYVVAWLRDVSPTQIYLKVFPGKAQKALPTESPISKPKVKSFFQIFCQWFTDKHNMVCRPIVIVESMNSGEAT
jgi:hypothetical protein